MDSVIVTFWYDEIDFVNQEFPWTVSLIGMSLSLLTECESWLRDHMGPGYNPRTGPISLRKWGRQVGSCDYQFRNEDDAVLFQLTWGY